MVMRSMLTVLFFLSVLICTGVGTPVAGIDSTLFIEALVRHYDAEPTSHYLAGYRWDRILRRREFHQPVTIIPLEIHYGVGFYGGAGHNNNQMPPGWMNLEQPVSVLSSKQTQRIYQQLDLDLFKTNLSYYIFGTSGADINTGLNLRYGTIFNPPDLPTAEWGTTQASWDPGERQFSPRILGIGVSNSVMLQWDESWFINLRYSYGAATVKFYASGESGLDPAPSGWGPTVSYDLGVRYILDPGQMIRYAIGLEFRHSYTRINRITDEADVTPISGFKLPGLGLFVTLSAFYGGKLSSGDLGKQFYYRRDFITAKEKFTAFLEVFPRHANRRHAQKLIERCNKYIPLQLYREGRRFELDGNLLKALDRYRQAELNADSNLTLVILAAYERLAELPLQQAESLSDLHKVQQALDLVSRAASYSKTARKQLPAYEARAAIFRGQAALKYGFYSKALEQYDRAMDLDPSLGVELNQLRYQVAAALIRVANEIEDLAAIRLAIQSLEKADELMGGLSKSSAAVLTELKARLATYDESRLQRHIDRRMAEAREKLYREQKNVLVGMTIPDVQELLGEPAEIVYKIMPDCTNYQLWIYRIDKYQNIELSFQDYILFKIERP